METNAISNEKKKLGNIFQVGSAKRIRTTIVKLYDIMDEMRKRIDNLEKQVGTQEIDRNFEKRLTEIQGIGKKTAKDIVNKYPTEETLREAIKTGEHLPFRNDIEKKLKWKFSRK